MEADTLPFSHRHSLEYPFRCYQASETSETYYYQLRKAAYLCHSKPKESAVSEVCAQLNITEKTATQLLEQVYAIDTFQWYGGVETEDELDDVPLGIDFNTLYQQMYGMPLLEMDKVIYTVCTLCRDHERAGFIEGIKIGIGSMVRVSKPTGVRISLSVVSV